MYCTVVTICTAQWSLYVPHSGHYMYHTVVTICTTSLTSNNSTFCTHTVFMCFVWISEQTAIISLYNINWLVFVTETECVYCAVRTGCLYNITLSSAQHSSTPAANTHSRISLRFFFTQSVYQQQQQQQRHAADLDKPLPKHNCCVSFYACSGPPENLNL